MGARLCVAIVGMTPLITLVMMRDLKPLSQIGFAMNAMI